MRRRLSAFCLALAALVGGPVAAHDGDGLPAARVVQVKGEGEASGVPDRAQLSMTVEARNVELAAAEAKVNAVVRAYLAEAKALGAKEEDLSTASYSVNAEYDYNDGKQVFRGYRAARDITVKVRDLSKIGDYLLRATKVGINQVNPPVLESSRQKEIEREALRLATLDAKANAGLIADTLGLKLGPARTVNATGQTVQPPVPMPRMAMKAMAMADGAPSGNEQMGFSGGEIRHSTTVTVEFELLP